jgi:hypothetical protein
MINMQVLQLYHVTLLSVVKEIFISGPHRKGGQEEVTVVLVSLTSNHGDSGLTAEPSDLAVGREDAGRNVARCATHEWHFGAYAELVDVVSAVGVIPRNLNK